VSTNKGGTYAKSKASFGVGLSTSKSRTWNLSQGDYLIVGLTNSRYWEETKDAECEGVETSR
jgi:hypothetical protein